MDPLEFITIWHVVIMHMGAFIRLLAAYDYENKKLKEEKKNFVWSIYFSDKWDNWAAHYIFMWAGLMTLPSLIDLLGQEYIPVLKEIRDTESLNMLFTFALGFTGYDLMKWFINKFKSKVE